MQKIRTFFRSAWLSCTSPEYYKDLVKTPVSFSVKYLMFFSLLISLITTVMIMVPLAAFDAQGALMSVRESVPQDLTANITNGRLSINRPLPYTIPLSFEGEEVAEVENLVVFESDENILGLNDVIDQNAFVVVTETSAYIREDENQASFKSYSFSDITEDVSLSTDQVTQFIDTVKNHPIVTQKLYVPLVAAFLLLFVLPFTILGSLIGAAIMAIATFLMARVLTKQLTAGNPITYSKAFQFTIHSSTLLIIVQQVLNVAMPGHPFSGWLYLIVFLIWTGFLLNRAYGSAEAPIAAKLASKSSEKTAKSRKK